MAETITEVRADIEQTRARMADAIAELEKKANVAERVREHPWAAVAIAFGAGLALSRPRGERMELRAPADTRQTGSRLGGAFDQIVTAAIGGIVGALHSRVDDVVASVVKKVQPPQRVTPPPSSTARPVGTEDYAPAEVPLRAD